MKKIFIVGLGLMGSSYAEKLTLKGFNVFGYDLNVDTINQAVLDKVIISGDLNEIKDSDLVILALYPKDNILFVKKHRHLFTNQLVTDISGNKTEMMRELNKLFDVNVRYVSHHPMAGREKSGYINKDITMFKGANFLIIKENHTNDSDIDLLIKLSNELEFKKYMVLSPSEHDKLVAHTSQLTHLIAVSLMLSENLDKTKDATGDSFRDLTRIAKINENMWTELFIGNKDFLIEETDNFINVLNEFKKLISEEKTEVIKEKLRVAKEKRISYDEVKIK